MAGDSKAASGRRTGREKEFAEFVAAYEPKALATAWRILGSLADAEDAVQDAFLRAWRGIRHFRKEAKLGTWFYRILASACADAAVSRSTHRRREGSDAALDIVPARSALPEAEAAVFEARDRIMAALQSLSENQRKVFVLKHYEGLDVAEIADALDMAKGTVKSHLARAVFALRAQLRPGPEPEGEG